MMGDMMDMMGGMGLWMVVVVIAVAAVLGTAIYLGIRAALASRRKPELERPRELLGRRLATGEITPEEYYEREAVLRSDEPVGRRGGRRG
jgi:uncharacterized membrane protein